MTKLVLSVPYCSMYFLNPKPCKATVSYSWIGTGLFKLLLSFCSLMASRERTREVTNFNEPMKSATIHGVIPLLSPIKKGGKSVFCNEYISDGRTTKRIVAFSPSQHSEMEKYKNGRKVVGEV